MGTSEEVARPAHPQERPSSGRGWPAGSGVADEPIGVAGPTREIVERRRGRVGPEVVSLPCLPTVGLREDPEPGPRAVAIERPLRTGRPCRDSGVGGSAPEHHQPWDAEQTLGEAVLEHDVYAPGDHSSGCQFETLGHARTIVGVRGAEWANVVWSPATVRVMIFDSIPPAPTLSRPLEELNVQHELVEIGGSHVAVETSRIDRFVA